MAADSEATGNRQQEKGTGYREQGTAEKATAKTEVLSWDGRLDNRGDLLLLLADLLRGETSNAALARAAYERWGTDGFVKLIGDWSLVIHDHVNRAIVLASDFAGGCLGGELASPGVGNLALMTRVV